jgi:hypothetical protein
MLRWPCPWLLVAVSIASGCGGAKQPAPNTAQTHAWAAEPAPSVASVKSCLQRHGLTVYGKPDRPPRPDWDASDHGELYAGDAALYFYSSHKRAARLERWLEGYVAAANQSDADRHLTLVRRGSVRVVYEGSIDPTPVDSCLSGASPWEGP